MTCGNIEGETAQGDDLTAPQMNGKDLFEIADADCWNGGGTMGGNRFHIGSKIKE